MAYLDDYEDDGKKKGLPVKGIVIAVVAVVVLGAAGVLAFNLLSGSDEPEPVPDDTTTAVVVGGDGQETETVTDVTEGEPEQVETVVDIDAPEDEGAEPEEQEPSAAEAYDKPEYKSSAIPMEEKMKMIEGNEIDASTEEKYAQYGALNIDQMKDVAIRWTNEWTAMVNDGQWDKHSAVLKSMMDIDYVNNHGTEFEVSWLYECLHDTLYVSSESMLFKDIKEVRIINSVPSPLTYMSIEVNVTHQSVEESYDDTVTYKMALNRDYQVSKFSVSY